MSPAQIAFAGTPDFAVPTLEALVAAGYGVPVVLTQPDRPAGRGRQPTPSPVKRAALAAGARVLQPESLADAGWIEQLGPPPAALIVIAYGLLLPGWLLGWARCGAINVHASLLPRWRGAAPIQRAILAGDAETGVSIMQMTRGLDTGPVFATARVPIGPATDAPTLHDTLAALGARTLLSVLPGILDGSRVPVPQDDAAATYAKKLAKAEGVIDWREPAVALDRKVRALAGWPVAESTLTDGRRIRVWASRPIDAGKADAPPGTVIAAGADGIDVATGAGVLRLVQVQPPGGRVMPSGAYVAAHSLAGAAFVCP